MAIRDVLEKLANRKPVAAEEIEEVVSTIMDGAMTPAQIGGFLMGLRTKGETVDEIAGAARAMRRHATKVETTHDVVDTCGTGGDGAGTFNISTAAAMIAAGAGVVVAKHGNRAMSGTVGGADVLEELGVKLELGPEQVKRCLDEAGIAFLFAQAFHPAMRHVGGVRRELGVRTVFNLLGPLSNPAGARRQVLGVFSERWLEPLAGALAQLGSERALVVHGDDGLDEMTLCGATKVAELREGAVRVYEVTPEEYGFERCAPDALAGGSVGENAAILRRILEGQATPAQSSIAQLNAAAAIWVSGRVDSLAAGVQAAGTSVASGAALASLNRLVEVSNA